MGMAQEAVSKFTFVVRRMHHYRQEPLPRRHWFKRMVVVNQDAKGVQVLGRFKTLFLGSVYGQSLVGLTRPLPAWVCKCKLSCTVHCKIFSNADLTFCFMLP